MPNGRHQMAKSIELWPIGKLKPYAKNPRTHNAAQVAQLAASIVEYGFTNPLLVVSDGTIIAGHGRLEAAKQVGLKEVPVILLDHLTPAQRRAYVIADNQLALQAGWDDALLAEEMHALNGLGFDLSLTGFDEKEIDQILAPLQDEQEKPSEAGGKEDEAPAPPKHPVSREGDVWLLGNHRLLCGDSTDPAAIARLMGGKQAHLLFTSPPYGNQRDYTTGGISDWDKLMQGVFSVLPMRDDGQVLVNLGQIHKDGEWQPYWQDWIAWMREKNWRRFGWYVWDQGPGLPGDWNGRFAPSFEFVFHFNKTPRKPNKIIPCKWAGHVMHEDEGGLREKDGTVGKWTHAEQPVQENKIPDNVIRITRHKARGVETEHPAVFPVRLPAFIMQAYSAEGEIVYEPFCGSGTTIIAGEQTGRAVRAMELAPAYVDVAVRRWREIFPNAPLALEGKGTSFEETAAARSIDLTQESEAS